MQISRSWHWIPAHLLFNFLGVSILVQRQRSNQQNAALRSTYHSVLWLTAPPTPKSCHTAPKIWAGNRVGLLKISVQYSTLSYDKIVEDSASGGGRGRQISTRTAVTEVDQDSKPSNEIFLAGFTSLYFTFLLQEPCHSRWTDQLRNW